MAKMMVLTFDTTIKIVQVVDASETYGSLDDLSEADRNELSASLEATLEATLLPGQEILNFKLRELSIKDI